MIRYVYKDRELIMKFLKDNSYDIVKLIVNQVGISIFSLVLYTAAGLILDIDLYLSIFAVLFYAALVFMAAWDMGAQDRLKVDTGKLKQNNFKGALVAGVANIPNAIFIVAAIIFIAVHLASGSEGAYTAFGIINLIFRLFCAMYIGILTAIFPVEAVDGVITEVGKTAYLNQSIGYIVCLLIPVIASAIGYYLGMKNVKIFAASPKNRK